jgi:hypothetical protein
VLLSLENSYASLGSEYPSILDYSDLIIFGFLHRLYTFMRDENAATEVHMLTNAGLLHAD